VWDAVIAAAPPALGALSVLLFCSGLLLGLAARRYERRGGLLLIAGLACSFLTAFAWILALARLD
jgi:hypothetical protein